MVVTNALRNAKIEKEDSKMKLYDAVVPSTLPYIFEVWRSYCIDVKERVPQHISKVLFYLDRGKLGWSD